MKCRHFLLLFLFLHSLNVYAQRDANWVLGDSVGINFNTNPPSIDTNRVGESQEATASISDDNGNLLFYVGSPETGVQTQQAKFVIRSSNDSIMQGGDSLFGHYSMTQGALIIPTVYNSNKYFIFHIGISLTPTVRRVLCYSIVDISLNSGLGALTTVNITLADSVSEKLTAVKSANGTDWWVIFTKDANGQLCKFKVDSSGISNIMAEAIYFGTNSIPGQLCFSKNGDRLGVAGGGESSLVMDFDRCTGVFSNINLLDTSTYLQNPYTSNRYGCAFSANGELIYLNTFDSLWQFDLTASNILASRVVIHSVPNVQGNVPDSGVMCQLMLGPDDKIYLSNASQIPDSLSQHLSVIEYPNNQGVSCNFLPYSLSLHGRQSLMALPNMVNYNLGLWEGGNCDSILAGNNEQTATRLVNCYPNPTDDKVSFSLPGNERLKAGKMYSTAGQLILEFDSSELSLIEWPAGIYIYRIKSVVDKFYFGKIIKY